MDAVITAIKSKAPYVVLHLVSDAHIGANSCQLPAFKQYIQDINNDPNAYAVFLGDLTNNNIPGSVGDMYDENLSPEQQLDTACEILAPIKHKTLAVMGGNHEYRTKRSAGINITKRLAKDIGISERYMDGIGVLKVNINKGPSYSILLSHGAMGGSKVGAGLTRCEDFLNGFEGIDALAVGHSHKPSAAPIARTVWDPYNKTFRTKLIYIMVATGWQGYSGYPARMMLKPTPIVSNHYLLGTKRKEIKAVL